MCNWFSCVTKGDGELIYIGEKDRKKVYSGKSIKGQSVNCLERDEIDSHSAICAYFGLDCDKVNKYEFRPLDNYFDIDQLNTKNDSELVKEKLLKLDFTDLKPTQLILKPIINPFKDIACCKITTKDIELLKQRASVWDSVGASVWASVWDSVRDSVWASVGDSVGASVWASVWASVGASVWASVRDSVGASVWASVGDSVRDSVWASVMDSVWAYTGSFFNLPKWKYIKHKKGQYPFQPLVDLWERGIVPSFDGKVWRLHGYGGKVLKTIEDISKC